MAKAVVKDIKFICILYKYEYKCLKYFTWFQLWNKQIQHKICSRNWM